MPGHMAKTSLILYEQSVSDTTLYCIGPAYQCCDTATVGMHGYSELTSRRDVNRAKAIHSKGREGDETRCFIGILEDTRTSETLHRHHATGRGASRNAAIFELVGSFDDILLS